MKTTKIHETVTATKLIVRVLQDLVAAEHFDTYADLADALKCRCAQLKIPYDGGLVSDALDRLELGGKVRLVGVPVQARVVEPQPEPVIIGRDEATNLSRGFLQRYHQEHDQVTHPLQDIEALRRVTADQTDDAIEQRERVQQQRTRDRAQAFRLVVQDIIATKQRCDALEAAIVEPVDDTEPVPR